jgi:predicted phosphodiesterase
VEGTRFFLCHAAPSDPLYRYLPANSPEWATEIAALSTDVLLVGHTHTPFVQAAGPSIVVNPGSLGQSKNGVARACYAIWDGQVSLASAEYEMQRTLDKIERMPVSARVKGGLKAVLIHGG